MIQSRETAEKKEERYDLFSSLLEAHSNEDGGGEAKLTTSELVGKQTTICSLARSRPF